MVAVFIVIHNVSQTWKCQQPCCQIFPASLHIIADLKQQGWTEDQPFPRDEQHSKGMGLFQGKAIRLWRAKGGFLLRKLKAPFKLKGNCVGKWQPNHPSLKTGREAILRA
jgi:hypothetical protein